MIKNIIKDKRGNGLILSCVIVLVLSIIFFFIAEHSRTEMTVSSVRDGLESVATNISTNNCDSIYQSQREGYFTSNVLENDKWQPKIDKSNLDKFIKETLGAKKEGSVYIKRNKEGEVDFKLSDIKVNIINPKLAPNNEEKNKSTFTVEVIGNLEVHKMFSIFSDTKNVKVNVGSMTEGAVATIQSTDNLILSINIPEYDIQKVATGMRAIITSDTLKDKVEGELVRISPVANSGDSGSGFSAEIVIENGQGMFIGTNAKAEIIISGKKNVILAPIDSVKDIDGNASLFIKEADGSFKEVPVTIGAKNDYYVEVSGSQIREGMEIKAIVENGESNDTMVIDEGGNIDEGSYE